METKYYPRDSLLSKTKHKKEQNTMPTAKNTSVILGVKGIDVRTVTLAPETYGIVVDLFDNVIFKVNKTWPSLEAVTKALDEISIMLITEGLNGILQVGKLVPEERTTVPPHYRYPIVGQKKGWTETHERKNRIRRTSGNSGIVRRASRHARSKVC